MNAKEFAENHDLTKPLSKEDLIDFTWQELEEINKIFVTRAMDVAKQIGMFRADCKVQKESAAQGYINIIHEIGEQVVFRHSPDWRFNKHNLFVPGAWWQESLDELAALKSKQEYLAETRDEREKEKILGMLTSLSE